MMYYPFPAQLRADYNSINVFGHAVIAEDGESINFTCEFIPLVPLGECASISWILGNRVLKTFQGTVYLSSPGLLRLVSVGHESLAQTKDILRINTRIPAKAAIIKKDKPNKNQRTFDIEILYMSKKFFKLRAFEYVGENSILAVWANVEFLTLEGAGLRVAKRVLMSRSNALLICEVLNQTDENIIAISTHSARLEKQEERLEQGLF